MANENVIQLPADDAGGKKVRTITTDLGSGDHHMEAVILTYGSGQIVDTTTPLPVYVRPPTTPGIVTQALTRVTSASAGVALISGAAIRTVRIKAYTNNSGDIYVGYLGARPISGTGYVLARSEYADIQTDALHEVFVVASISGDQITVLGQK